jgi:hypothetical protein
MNVATRCEGVIMPSADFDAKVSFLDRFRKKLVVRAGTKSKTLT